MELFNNENADLAAKKAAENDTESVTLNIPYDLQEGYLLLEKVVWKQFNNEIGNCPKHFSSSELTSIVKNNSTSRFISHLKIREIICVSNRLKLNALKTKYCKNINCVCGQTLSIDHIFKFCADIKEYIPREIIQQINSYPNRENVMNNPSLLINLSMFLINSPIGLLL